MDITVQKFGGSSLADDAQLDAVAERVGRGHRAGRRLVVVVSARGDTTDRLVRAAGTAHGTAEPDADAARETDQLLATGELASAALLALVLRGKGVPARSLSGPQAGIRAEGRPGEGVITTIDTEPVRSGLAGGSVVVAAGFQALNDGGDVVTLGRGGSDTSAVALAAAHGAGCCEIYTDVDGVYRADPRVVDRAELIPSLASPVMAEMAWSGARVLHPRAVELAATHHIDIQVRHAHRGGAGSTILGGNPMLIEQRTGVHAVTHEDDVARIQVRCDDPGAPAGVEVLDALARDQIAVDALAWPEPGHPRLAFCVSTGALPAARAALEPLTAVEARTGFGKVSLVGAGLLSRPGITATALTALASEQVAAECVSSTQARISFLVPADSVRAAVVALYERLGVEAPSLTELSTA